MQSKLIIGWRKELIKVSRNKWNMPQKNISDQKLKFFFKKISNIDYLKGKQINKNKKCK